MAELSAANFRRWNEDISGSLTFSAAAVTSTIKTVRNANSTIYVQRVIVYITTDAAQSLTIQDSAGKVLCSVTVSPGANTRWDFPLGGDKGVPCGEGASLTATFSAAGLAGTLSWEGYQRLTSAVAQGTTN